MVAGTRGAPDLPRSWEPRSISERVIYMVARMRGVS